MPNMTFPSRPAQRGAATLLVTMVLLFSTSIIMLYLNRSILFEQKTSANQMRSTSALEMAEAGMEWATGMLNTPNEIDTACALQPTTKISFRRKYVQTQWGTSTATATDVVPATTTYPGCKVKGNTLTCGCPNVPSSGSATAALDPEVLPGFTVAFAATDDPEAVKVVATGCTAQAGACTPGTAGNSDATATVSAILKLRPLLRAAPASPLTCGGACNLSGSYNVINSDAATGGIMVNAGSNITEGKGTAYTTIPGQPIQNALVSSDASLAALSSSDSTCSGSSMFSAYFGSTIEKYAASPLTKTISGCTPAEKCGKLVDDAYNAGWRSFYFPDGFARNNSSGSLGTVSDPVTLVSNQGFDITGSIDIYGMVFSNKAFVDAGTGNAIIHGAMVTCSDYKNNGNGTLEYDADVLKGVRRSTGALTRVPGSWTDRCTASATHPPVITCN